MKIGLVIDATCDVSRSLLDRRDLVLLPYSLEFDHRHVWDHRDPAETLNVYRRYLSDRSVNARSDAASATYLRELFLSERILRYDRVLVLTATDAGGAMCANATQASYAILQDYRDRRAASGRPEAFVLRVVDSGTVGAGCAVLAMTALGAIESGPESFEQLRRQIRDLAARTRCRLVPGDLARVRNQHAPIMRSARRAADSVACRWAGVRPILEVAGGAGRVVGRVRGFERSVTRVLDWARRALVNGRIRPVLAMSFGGDPRIIRDMDAYQSLEALAADRRCDLQLSVMSASLAVAFGPGAFSLGLIDV